MISNGEHVLRSQYVNSNNKNNNNNNLSLLTNCIHCRMYTEYELYCTILIRNK